MRLAKARVRKYRSIHDTGWFDVEPGKTILVGPNEAGKTVVLQALQQLNPPKEVRGFDPLRDYPRSEYNDITTGKVQPKDVTVVEARFVLDEADREVLPAEFGNSTYVLGRRLDNSCWHNLEGAPEVSTYGSLKRDFVRLCAHLDSRVAPPAEGDAALPLPSAQLETITKGWSDTAELTVDQAARLAAWWPAPRKLPRNEVESVA